MLENRDDSMSIVVLEAGAAWPTWLVEYQRLAPNAVVVAQAREELPEAFASRVLHRIAAAQAQGTRTRVGVLVVGSAGDAGHRRLRECVARSIVQSTRDIREAQLVLGADGHDGETRQALFTLAGALCEEFGAASPEIKVRFSAARSGVMRSFSQLPEAPLEYGTGPSSRQLR